ncbi:ABC-2 family transporter protein [Candidatus Daviesbacteria bacterium]|nr:ABC-2 family transporter protein [Candidatus Daviesbacteria bacterium]
MKKYQTVFTVTLANIFQYRTNFFLERLRSLISLVTLYFLWQAVFAEQNFLFGYSREQIFTYVLISHLASFLVLLTTTGEIAGEIAGGGKFFSYLVRPVSYIKYWLAVDLGYKLVSTIFALLEIIIFVRLFNVTVYFPLIWSIWILALGVFLLAMMLNFLLGFLVSLVAFWTQEVWAPRFLFIIILGLASGSFFPLDVLPSLGQQIISWTPFPYLVFFPANVFLGRVVGGDLVLGLVMMFFWIGLTIAAMSILWQKGLKIYEGGSI